MSKENHARVQRLITWLKRHKRDWLDDAGEVMPAALAKNLWGTTSYWSDVIRIETSGKSFGSKTARRAEEALGMPPFMLDGLEKSSDWPFKLVSEERFTALTEHQRGAVEYAMIMAIKQIEDEAQRPKRVGIF